MNSGDWVESLTALEYHKGEWKMYKYNEKDLPDDSHEPEEKSELMNNEQIFNAMLNEFKITTSSSKTQSN